MRTDTLALMRQIQAGTVGVEDLDRRGKIVVTSLARHRLVTIAGRALALTAEGVARLNGDEPKRRPRRLRPKTSSAPVESDAPDWYPDALAWLKARHADEISALDRIARKS